MRIALQFITSFIVIPLLDFVWIGLLMKNFYVAELGPLGRTEEGVFKPMIFPAVITYVCLAAGLTLFVLPQADGKILNTFLYGAALGLVVYGVYDLTNLSILQNYSLKMTLVDIAWGTFLCAITAALVELITEKIKSLP